MKKHMTLGSAFVSVGVIAACTFAVAGCSASQADSDDSRRGEATVAASTDSDARQRLHSDIAEFNEEYPEGVTPPTVGDLVPELGSYDVVEVNKDGTVIVEANDPSAASNGDKSAGSGAASGDDTRVVIEPGDLAVLAAVDWQCAWMREYLDAANAKDTDRMGAAETELKKFPTLDVITRYNPELAQQHSDIVEPMLSGDLATGTTWVKDNCKPAR